MALLVVAGELLGGWSQRSALARVEGPRMPPALAIDRVPAAALYEPIAAATIRTAARTPLSPALSRPVALVDAFREPHLLAPGETLGLIAERYGVSLEALIWTNGLERGDALAVGRQLRIPRVPGVTYTVQPGDTVAQIASLHQVPVEAILTFGPNRLGDGGQPAPGDELFVPGVGRPLPGALLESFGGLEGLARRAPVPAAAVREAQTNMRQGPGTLYPPVTKLDAGRQVELRGRHEEWVKVALGVSEGWVRSDLLAVDPAVVAGLPELRDFPPPPPRWVWPARGTITSGFGRRWGTLHNGLDIANRAWTPIMAASAGWVREAGWCRGYGYCVKIRHEGGIETIYGHLIDQPVVAEGEEVAPGQLIGHMGSTFDRAGGGYSTGVHLHFTILVNSKAVDPLRLLP